ncbi:MAG TPA: 4-hydroxythreonine-4-phosphate dehydrogenase PdxA [Firmicutes bacterium]|nr:4-hydroxythreonine-4-phosphate dehydrogenase PdxA [Bacillota bacterium]
MKKITAAVTMGDPAGIGPEIICKMYAKGKAGSRADSFVIGDMGPMLCAAGKIPKKPVIHPMKTAADIKKGKNIINLYDMEIIKEKDYKKGISCARAGMASFMYIKAAIDMALKKEIDAVVTAPINKHSLHLAGLKFPGHTEILAEFTGTKKFAMMLAGEGLRVVLVTIHNSLKKAAALINVSSVYETIEIAHNALVKDFGIKKPKIAVLGLNPHAGEQGAFGDEEKKYIIPAMKKALKKGIKVFGPYPADTLFHYVVKKGSHDAVVCMYHDQGLIPLKLLYFDSGVNITLGLPIIRTSPDHGTAYDIAGKGRASAGSIIAAFKTAVEIAENRKKQV